MSQKHTVEPPDGKNPPAAARETNLGAVNASARSPSKRNANHCGLNSTSREALFKTDSTGWFQ